MKRLHFFRTQIVMFLLASLVSGPAGMSPPIHAALPAYHCSTLSPQLLISTKEFSAYVQKPEAIPVSARNPRSVIQEYLVERKLESDIKSKEFLVSIKTEWDRWKKEKHFEELLPLLQEGRTIAIYGSARKKEDAKSYQLAHHSAQLAAWYGFSVVTGGGPGIMEAANRGMREFISEATDILEKNHDKDKPGILAALNKWGNRFDRSFKQDDLEAFTQRLSRLKSIGLNIKLPHEQSPNDWQDLPLMYKYFFLRKLMFWLLSRNTGGVAFEGGFGTGDEGSAFTNTLRMKFVGKEFWGGFKSFLEEWEKDYFLPEWKEIRKEYHNDSEDVFINDVNQAIKLLCRQAREDNWTSETIDNYVYSFFSDLAEKMDSLSSSGPVIAVEGAHFKEDSVLGRTLSEFAALAWRAGYKLMYREQANGAQANSAGGIIRKASDSFKRNGDESGKIIPLVQYTRLKEKIEQFRVNASDKISMLRFSQALVIFPGGWSALEQVFETLTLIQTQKVRATPVILVGRQWKKLVKWISGELVENGTIAPEDIQLFEVVDIDENETNPQEIAERIDGILRVWQLSCATAQEQNRLVPKPRNGEPSERIDERQIRKHIREEIDAGQATIEELESQFVAWLDGKNKIATQDQTNRFVGFWHRMLQKPPAKLPKSLFSGIYGDLIDAAVKDSEQNAGGDMEKFIFTMTNNKTIRDFLNWDESIGRRKRIPYREVIAWIFENNGKVVREILEEIASYRPQVILCKGNYLLGKFNKQTVYEATEVTSDWLKFASIRTTGEYGLDQLLESTLGNAYTYLQLKTEDNATSWVKIEKEAHEDLRNGLLILCAIALADTQKESTPALAGEALSKVEQRSSPIYDADIIQSAI